MQYILVYNNNPNDFNPCFVGVKLNNVQVRIIVIRNVCRYIF